MGAWQVLKAGLLFSPTVDTCSHTKHILLHICIVQKCECPFFKKEGLLLFVLVLNLLQEGLDVSAVKATIPVSYQS